MSTYLIHIHNLATDYVPELYQRSMVCKLSTSTSEAKRRLSVSLGSSTTSFGCIAGCVCVVPIQWFLVRKIVYLMQQKTRTERRNIRHSVRALRFILNCAAFLDLTILQYYYYRSVLHTY